MKPQEGAGDHGCRNHLWEEGFFLCKGLGVSRGLAATHRNRSSAVMGRGRAALAGWERRSRTARMEIHHQATMVVASREQHRVETTSVVSGAL